MMMIHRNLLIATAALAVIVAPVAAAAAASDKSHHRGHKRIYAAPAYRTSPPPIYSQGRYLGTDPDPAVRFEILRDPYFARR
jgi:hypothetical protein